jgi:hypothetical protein
MIRGCLPLLLLTLACTALAVDPGTPREQSDRFMKLIEREKVQQAYDGLFEGTVFQRKQPQAKVMMVSQTRSALELLGAPTGFEFLKAEPLGESIMRLLYVLKFEEQPMLWEFHFYMFNERWSVIKLNFDADLNTLKLQR